LFQYKKEIYFLSILIHALDT